MLQSAEMDFIEGDNGVLYFMKIGRVETTGMFAHQKEWKVSSEFKYNP